MTNFVEKPVLLTVTATLGFLALHGVLWSAHPMPGIWLAGSIVLGLLWGIAFMRLITRGEANE